MILATIDIGSNAARILISEVKKKGKEVHFDRLNLVRIPLRLGFDVFQTGNIGPKRKQMLLDTIKAFNSLMDIYAVDYYVACATSAMRDAKNAKSIIKDIKKRTSIEIEVITGDLEAEIIYENHIAELLDIHKTYLYIDVGGGSTELTLFNKSKVELQHSYNIGTVRMLTNKIKKDTWDELNKDVKSLSKKYKNMVAIGSGGNINKTLSLLKKEDHITLHDLKLFTTKLNKMSVDQRMQTYNLKRDRADVLVPALTIYNHIMSSGNINHVIVPKIGLVDGLMYHLYQIVKKGKYA